MASQKQPGGKEYAIIGFQLFGILIIYSTLREWYIDYLYMTNSWSYMRQLYPNFEGDSHGVGLLILHLLLTLYGIIGCLLYLAIRKTAHPHLRIVTLVISFIALTSIAWAIPINSYIASVKVW